MPKNDQGPDRGLPPVSGPALRSVDSMLQAAEDRLTAIHADMLKGGHRLAVVNNVDLGLILSLCCKRR